MKNNIRSTLLILIVAAMTPMGGCDSSTDPYAKTSPNTVAIKNMSFSPFSLTVQKGTTVTWQNDDSVDHTATSDTGAWDSGNIPAGGSKSVTFNSSGTFPYHCTVHPEMTATVVVQ